jgi:hypothetical protein
MILVVVPVQISQRAVKGAVLRSAIKSLFMGTLVDIL